ncbi:chemotaxis protein CheD [Psychromonas aquimarina]|uniref:chemotaxis protein CheD n=1 Tax=Psychromonas aquimarina TaxID=444919 RepID=UPI0003FBCA4E|nr:chemotaxis protein CheD [Psychromonas aquimarina]
MNIQPYKNSKRIIIEPGEYYVSSNQEVISTLLGSCVAACLYDPVRGVTGMNHFLLAYRSRQDPYLKLNSEAGRYGVHAMELLIHSMVLRGAKKRHLKAKCFGGGDVLSIAESSWENRGIGDVNVDFIHKYLKSEKIPLISSSLGGRHGRNIHFMGHDFSVFMKKINSGVEHQVQLEEKKYWKKVLQSMK